MEIRILTFGQIADITGSTEFKISDVKTTEELSSKLAEVFPGLSSIKYAIAVNHKVVHSNTELKNEDTVAFLPPFSGG